MYSRVLKLVGVNVLQGIIISGVVMIGKRIYRKLKIDHVNKKYDEMSKEYENNRNKSNITQEN